MAYSKPTVAGIKIHHWNPVHGCTKISPGCDKCYSERRYGRVGNGMFETPFNQVVFVEDRLGQISALGYNHLVVKVNGSSDTLHEQIKDTDIQKIINVVRQFPQYIFQVLTKRPERLPNFDWPSNVWLGVSVETQDYLWRVDPLLRTNASIKWLAIQPILGPMGEMNLEGIDWVFMGGEQGRTKRPFRIQWLRQVRDQCVGAGIPLFYTSGYELLSRPATIDGQVYKQYPTIKE